MSTKSEGPLAVAIVGGGASGTILAAQLARRGVSCALIDGSGRVGRGVAYSTSQAAHLLNVRAESMSAWADKPTDFAKRFAATGGSARDFAERRFYGRYLSDILGEAVASGCVRIVAASAVGAHRANGDWHVELDDGSTIAARALALATGNQQPSELRAFEQVDRRYIANPWGDDADAAVRELAAAGGNALLVGTGLTMVDLVLSLEAAGHRGGIVALSRRGLIPRAHADFRPAPVERGGVPHRSLQALWRWLRRRGGEVGWRAAIDSLRPHSQALWHSLEDNDRRRFLRHARPWWDVHRHRIAPQVSQTLARLVAEGRLRVMAGRIRAAREDRDQLSVEVVPRGATAPQAMNFAYAFNCTGPLQSISRTRDPLLQSLLQSGDVGPDSLDIGLEVDKRSRAGERIWVLGPLTKGRFWEIIAVPDIREQAARVAEDMSTELAA